MSAKSSHASGATAVAAVEIGVSDLDRAAEFYFDLLGVGTSEVSLVQASSDAVPLEGISPRGYVHAGWFVDDVDEQAKRLKAAGVRFTVEPRRGVGVERLAFLSDPDGTVIELVQGRRRYQNILAEDLARDELSWARKTPTLDHVAIAAGSLERTLNFYSDLLAVRPIGQIDLGGPTELLATHLAVGEVAIEIFTHGNPTDPVPEAVPRPDLGIRLIHVRSNLAQGHLVDPNGAALEVASTYSP